MKEVKQTKLDDRLTAAAEAKRAMLAKFKPKPTVADPAFEDRKALKAAELEAVRAARAAAKEAARQAVLDAQQAELDAKRSDRKERKALSKAEQKAARDARYAARKARQKR